MKFHKLSRQNDKIMLIHNQFFTFYLWENEKYGIGIENNEDKF